jgi:hypothetical protein
MDLNNIPFEVLIEYLEKYENLYDIKSITDIHKEYYLLMKQDFLVIIFEDYDGRKFTHLIMFDKFEDFIIMKRKQKLEKIIYKIKSGT